MQDQNFYSSILGQFDNDIKDAGLHISRDLINRFIASILTKNLLFFLDLLELGKQDLLRFLRGGSPPNI